jgi:PAS domain S-box-containing protein
MALPLATASTRYDALIRRWRALPDETVRHAAHEFGQELYGAGCGVLEYVAIHGEAVERLIEETPAADCAALLNACHRLLIAGLMPFEITHRGLREAHARLNDSEQRYRELFEEARDVIFSLDLDGRVTSINHAGETVLGCSRDAAIGRHISSMLAPGSTRIGRLVRRLATLEAGDRRLRGELEVLSGSGRRVPMDVSLRVLRLHGRAVGLQGIARDITDRKRAESALRHLNLRLEENVQRIAHALHDEASQLLASVHLGLADIQRELAPRDQARVGFVQRQLDQVEGELRRLAHELRPTILDDLGLVPACQFLAEGVSKRAGLSITVAGSTGGRLPRELETALYRVVQEAVNNAARHAQARRVVVEFRPLTGLLACRIADNGVGFDVAGSMAGPTRPGLGLIGMRERVVAVGGRLSIVSSQGRGTSVELEVPVECDDARLSAAR